jgi:hypothetical protein
LGYLGRASAFLVVIRSASTSLGVLRLPWAYLGVLGRAWACMDVLGRAWDNIPLRSNIPRYALCSALCATLDTYNLNKIFFERSTVLYQL